MRSFFIYFFYYLEHFLGSLLCAGAKNVAALSKMNVRTILPFALLLSVLQCSPVSQVKTEDGLFFFRARNYFLNEILRTFVDAGWAIVYQEEEISEVPPFYVHEGKYSVHDILEKALKGTDLVGQVCADGPIQIFKRPKGIIRVVGKVIDSKTGRGIPNVQVTTIRWCGTATDENGRYQIDAPNDEGIRFFYEPWEKYFDSQASIPCRGDTAVINVKMNLSVPGDREIFHCGLL